MLFNLIKDFTLRILRCFFWLYKLSKAKGSRFCKISFPVIIEGKGHTIFEQNVVLQKKCSLIVAKGATLNIAQNSIIEEKVAIRIGLNGHLHIDENVLIASHSSLLLNANWHIGRNSKIEAYCSIFSREAGCAGKLIIGQETHIGDYTIIDVCDDVIIGNDVAIGPNCVIYTHDHEYTNPDIPAWQGKLICKPVIIEDGAWVGSGVTILPGVRIGKHSVVAAGAVVSKSVLPFNLVGGVPAKIIKENICNND